MKIVILFPGYGSQYVGMGKELYDESRVMQEFFEEGSNCLNINFVKLCFASSDAEISKIENALVANFVVSASIYALLKEQGIKPDLVVGKGSGIHAALFAAEGISFPDMLYLISKYVTFYQELIANKSIKTIRITGLDTATVDQLCLQASIGDEQVSVALYESETTTIVVGVQAAIDRVKEAAQEQAKKIIDLEYIDGLYSTAMKPVIDQLTMYSEKVDFKDLQVPLLTTNTFTEIRTKEQAKEMMLNAMSTPVHWHESLQQLADYDVYIEVGPGTEIATQLSKLYPEKKIFSINKDADLKELKAYLFPEQNIESESDPLFEDDFDSDEDSSDGIVDDIVEEFTPKTEDTNPE